MAIKMRENIKSYAECNNCGCTQDEALKMFDLCIGEEVIKICDACNEKILKKTLKASCMVNAMLKSPKHIKIINARKIKNDKF